MPLTLTAAPWHHLTIAPADGVSADLAKMEKSMPGWVARTLDGRKATTTAELFAELASLWGFPEHFGKNWDALNDCLCDLSWLNPRGVTFCIAHPGKLLSNSTADSRRKLVAVLQHVASECNRPTGKGKSPRPFHVLWLVAPDDRAEVVAKWLSAGATFQLLPA